MLLLSEILLSVISWFIFSRCGSQTRSRLTGCACWPTPARASRTSTSRSSSSQWTNRELWRLNIYLASASFLFKLGRKFSLKHDSALCIFTVLKKRANFIQAKKIDKLGMHSSDTGLIHFDDVRVPASNIIGEEGNGFIYQMLQFQASIEFTKLVQLNDGTSGPHIRKISPKYFFCFCQPGPGLQFVKFVQHL